MASSPSLTTMEKMMIRSFEGVGTFSFSFLQTKLIKPLNVEGGSDAKVYFFYVQFLVCVH